jgi:NADH:ubiquinone oxidoreductase subunit 6 (subunit J)
MSQALFVVFGSVAVLSALLAVTRKDAVSAASWLVLMFFGLAAVFVLLEAYLVAVVQVLVYAGAIMVLFLFVIMLLDLKESDLRATTGPRLKVLGVVLAGAFLAAFLHVARDATDSDAVADRVAVALREPAPEGGAAPEPAVVALSPAAPEGAPPPPGTTEPGVASPDDRAWSGAFRTAAAPDAARRVTVTVVRDGAVLVSVDGAPQRGVAWTAVPGTRTRSASLALPGAPEGTRLEVTLERGGLAPAPGPAPDGSARGIGRALFEEWLLPFEVASLLLTGAIFGAVVLTKRRLA